MKLNAMFLAAALGVAGCGGGGTNPFMDQQSSTTTTEATGTDENTVTSSGGDGDTSTDQNGITSTGTPDAGTGTTGDKIEDMSWSSTSGHPRNVSYVKEPDENGIDVENYTSRTFRLMVFRRWPIPVSLDFRLDRALGCLPTI
jgi:hypothetical protein